MALPIMLLELERKRDSHCTLVSLDSNPVQLIQITLSLFLNNLLNHQYTKYDIIIFHQFVRDIVVAQW